MEPQVKKTWIYVVILLLIATIGGAVFGSRWISSYYVRQGRQAINQGDFNRAKMKLERALKYNSSNPLAYSYLGRVALGPADSNHEGYYLHANYSDAVSYYEKAFAVGLANENVGGNIQAMENIAYAYWNLKQYDKADAYYSKKLQTYPNSAFWARYFLGIDYFERLNRPQEAVAILVDAPAATDVETKYLYRIYSLLGRLYFYLGDSGNAIKYAKLAIQEVPQSVNDVHLQIAHMILAQKMAQQKDVKGALSEYNIATALARTELGSDGIFLCALSKIYFLAGDNAKAIQSAKQASAQKTPLDYPTSICLEVLVRSNLAIKNDKDAAKYIQDYLAGTEKFEQKNIFVQRNRKEFQTALNGL